MTPEEAHALAVAARRAVLATSGPGGRIDLVPVTFALDDDRLFIAVDHKPKTTTRLARLANIAAEPAVSLLVDHYDDGDWSRLWWIRLRGTAEVVDGAAAAAGLDLLAGKYAPYREMRPAGPVIDVTLTSWQWWSAASGATRLRRCGP